MNLRKDDVNKLILDNEKLVGYCYKKYIGNYSIEQINDIIQEGMYGLILAANRFDSSKGTKFSTFAIPYISGFAIPYISGCMLRYCREKLPICKIPRSMLNNYEENYYEINSIINYNSLDYKMEDEDCNKYVISIGKTDNYDYEIEELIESFLKTINNELDRDIMEEYYYSQVFGDKLKQEYYQDKYKISQSRVSKIISKYNKLFAKFINNNV